MEEETLIVHPFVDETNGDDYYKNLKAKYGPKFSITFYKEVVRKVLPWREEEVFILHYYESKSFGRISKDYNVSVARIRQIYKKATNNINDAIIHWLDHGFYDSLKLKEELDSTKEEMERLVRTIKTKYPEFGAEVNETPIEEKMISVSIDELDVGTRAYNCLRRHGITTCFEISEMSEEELMRIKNLGKKTARDRKSVV